MPPFAAKKLQSTICDNWQWVFQITVDEFWPTLLCRIVLIQPHWRVFSLDCLRSCHSISIGFKPRFWLGHSKTLIWIFLSHSEVDLLVCLRSLSCCINHVRLSLRSQTDDQTFSYRVSFSSINYGKCSRSWSCKAAPDHHTTTLPLLCQMMRVLCGTHNFQKVKLLSHHSTEYLFKILLNIYILFLYIINIFLANVRCASVFFLLSSACLALELSHGCRFFPVSFLLLNHEHWP